MSDDEARAQGAAPERVAHPRWPRATALDRSDREDDAEVMNWTCAKCAFTNDDPRQPFMHFCKKCGAARAPRTLPITHDPQQPQAPAGARGRVIPAAAAVARDVLAGIADVAYNPAILYR